MRVTRDGARSYYDGIDSMRTVINHELGSMTRQDMAGLSDINVIYAKTQRGELVQASTHRPEYGDFSQVVTYDQALDQIMQAEQAFYDLPSDVRRKYNDSPEVYYDTVTREVDEAVKADAEKKKAAKKEKEKADQLKAARKLVADNPEPSDNKREE